MFVASSRFSVLSDNEKGISNSLAATQFTWIMMKIVQNYGKMTITKRMYALKILLLFERYVSVSRKL